MAMPKQKIKFVPSKEKVDLSKIDDPLAKKKEDLVKKPITEHVDQLLSNKKFKKIMDFYEANNITFDSEDIPKLERRPIRQMLTPEEIQRLLDELHACNILSKFDFDHVSPVCVVRINGDDENLQVFDTMHGISVIAALAKRGRITVKNKKTGKKEPIKDWLDFEYPCWIIDTDDESFPAVAALYRNGEGSKPWGAYDRHRVYVRSHNFYNKPGSNGEYKLAAEKHNIMVSNNAVPLPEKHPDLGMTGTFSRIDVAAKKYKVTNMDEFKFIFDTNNKYWKGNNDASMFGFYGNLYRGYRSLGLPTSGKEFDAFLDELHAIIKTFFVSMPELKTVTTKAYQDWMKKQDRNAGNPGDECALSVVLKIYQRLGGKHPLLSIVNSFVYSPSKNVSIDIYDSLPLSIRQHVGNSEL